MFLKRFWFQRKYLKEKKENNNTTALLNEAFDLIIYN